MRIRRLIAIGHKLRRPEADFLREEMDELRMEKGRVQYRILYFFHGSQVVILSQTLRKEGSIPEAEIERTLKWKNAFARRPARHTYEEEAPNGEDERGTDHSRADHGEG